MVQIGSLVLLFFVIFLGMMTKKNVGIIGFLAAYVYGTFVTGMKAKEIYAGGFPTTVFFLIMASTFLFGIANHNGTSEVLAKNVSFVARGNNKLIPWMFFAAGAILAGVGGSMLILVVIMPIAYSTCLSRHLDVTMTSIIVLAGGMIGGLSPITLNGIVANTLAIQNGVDHYMPIWGAYSFSIFLMAFLAYLFFKGWKVPNTEPDKDFTPFHKAQVVTVICIILVCLATIFFKQNIGLVCLAFAAILILFNYCDQKVAIAAVPWGTLMLITGMSMLLHVVDKSGGITFLTKMLSGIITTSTAQPIMIALGGLMGAVSSGTGVVMPTLIPLAAKLAAANPDLNAISLMLGVIVGTNGVVLSPFSTVGALACGCAPDGVDVNKLYTKKARQTLILPSFFLYTADKRQKFRQKSINQQYFRLLYPECLA